MAISPEDFEKDKATLYAMGSIFCRGHHGDIERNAQGVCPECDEVIDYSLERTLRCPNSHTGNCKSCSIHCYKPEMRAGIKQIMAYGAPRMIYQHPAMTARYVRKTLREKRAIRRDEKAAAR